MTSSHERLAIAELTAMLVGEFDLSTMLDAVVHDARRGFDAFCASVILLDADADADDGERGVQVVAEALREPTTVDLSFLTEGPALDSALHGALTMIADLADAVDTRWPDYRRDAVAAGMRGMRGFPVKVLGTSVGALVVHTDEPWGARQSNEFGQVLANLAAIAISIAPHASQRRGDAGDAIDTLLQGTVVIATATGILAETTGTDPAQARLLLHRLARAHQTTATNHADNIVTAYNHAREHIAESELLVAPRTLPLPPHIDS